MDKYSATYLLWTITISDTGSVSVYEGTQRCDNTKKTLRTIASSIGLTVNEKWSSQQLARRLIDRIHEKEQLEAAMNAAAAQSTPKEPEKFSDTAKRYLINALFWKSGYRIASCILWLAILSIVSIPFNMADRAAQADYKERMDYRSRCAEGDFTAAHNILSELHTEYTKALGFWRAHGYREDQVRTLQERYYTALAYVFGQEIALQFDDPTKKADDKTLIQMLLDIPVDGRPLPEGIHANKMFYNSKPAMNDEAIDHAVYQSWVRFYNDRCDQLLEKTLMNRDMALAEKIIKRYRPEVITHFDPDPQASGYNIATVTYDNSRQEKAKLRLAEMEEQTRQF